jgi:hypothetical protein
MTPRGIVIHLSASRFGDAAQIRSWHTLPKPRGNGWSDIGYHRVILNGIRRAGQKYDRDNDGRSEPGRPERTPGAHCAANGMNRATLGVCCIGVPGWVPVGATASPLATTPYLTTKQAATLVDTLAAWCRAYKLDPTGTFQHNGRAVPVITQHSTHDPAKPLCASLDLVAVRAAVKRAMGAA